MIRPGFLTVAEIKGHVDARDLHGTEERKVTVRLGESAIVNFDLEGR
jgi:hypothetical protein